MESGPGRRTLPRPTGLIAIALALAFALPVFAWIATSGVKDVKHARDTLVVTGSARFPISANLATWRIVASAQESTPARAIRALRAKDAQIDASLKRGGLPGGAISRPPIRVEQVFVSVPTGLKKPAFRRVPAWHLTQGYAIETARIDTLVQTASRVGDLLAAGTDVAVSPIQYLSTKLTSAKFAALRLAVADARRRASTIAEGVSAKLGPVQKTALGVYQITPRNSTEVSDYGIDDVSSRLKDVESVVTVTFLIEH